MPTHTVADNINKLCKLARHRLGPALLTLACLLALSATSAVAATDAPAAHKKARKPAKAKPEPVNAERLINQEWDQSQGIFELLLAEMALHRGEPTLAGELYADIARHTKDSRTFRRAIEIASYQKQNAKVLALSKQWVDAVPEELQARQHLLSLLRPTAASAEMLPQIAKILELDKEKTTTNLLGLNQFLTGMDKQQVLGMVQALTEPYLKIPEAHVARAQSYVGVADKEAALASVEQALQVQADSETAAIMKAQLLGEKSPAAGFAFMQEFLTRNPKAKSARTYLAKKYAEQKQFKEALREFETLAKDNPDGPESYYSMAILALQQQDLGLAKKMFEHLLTLDIKEPDRIYFFLGQIAEQEKNNDAAIAAYEKVRSGQQYLGARIRLAGIYASTGKLSQGQQVLQNTLGLNEDESIQLLLVESQLLREAKRDKESFEVLDTGLRKFPDNTSLLYESALMAERLDMLPELEARLNRVLQLQPDNPNALNALGFSLADRNIRLGEAFALISAANKLKPNDPYIMDSLGWVLYRQGELGKSMDVLRKAMQTMQDPEIAAHLGEVLWQSGKRDEAQRLWQEAVQKNPDNETLRKIILKFNP